MDPGGFQQEIFFVWVLSLFSQSFKEKNNLLSPNSQRIKICWSMFPSYLFISSLIMLFTR